MNELAKLRVIFGYEEEAFRLAVPLYEHAWTDIPIDLLRDAVMAYIGSATRDTRFPLPGDIRNYVRSTLALRRELVQEDDTWPEWLCEIWGPVPNGPRKRKEALDKRRK